MSKVTDLGMNLIPSRLPKKNIVATEKAEEITSKIHAVVPEPQPIPVPVVEPVVEKSVEPAPKVQEVKSKKPEAKTQNPKTPQSILAPSVSSVKKRSARTIIEDPDAVRKTSFDFPVTLYRSMKIRLAEDGLSMRDYVIGLIEDDLNK